MFDLPNWFWNTLLICVLVLVNLVLWLHRRHCRAKNITPEQPFARFKKYKKHFTKWTDIFIMIFVLLSTLAYGIMIVGVTTNLPSDIPHEHNQQITRLALSFNFSLLLMYFTVTVIMVSLLSPFDSHITLTKRLILVAMCCIPLVLGTLYIIFDSSQDFNYYVKVLLYSCFPVVFINWPAILLGKSSREFYAKLFK